MKYDCDCIYLVHIIDVYYSVTVKTYLSPVETHCNNINYYIPDENNETRDFTDDAWTRLRMYTVFATFISKEFLT